LKEYNVIKFIGFGQCVALILYFFKIDIIKYKDKKEAISDMIRYWKYIQMLSKSDILPIANIPIKFK